MINPGKFGWLRGSFVMFTTQRVLNPEAKMQAPNVSAERVDGIAPASQRDQKRA